MKAFCAAAALHNVRPDPKAAVFHLLPVSLALACCYIRWLCLYVSSIYLSLIRTHTHTPTLCLSDVVADAVCYPVNHLFHDAARYGTRWHLPFPSFAAAAAALCPYNSKRSQPTASNVAVAIGRLNFSAWWIKKKETTRLTSSESSLCFTVSFRRCPCKSCAVVIVVVAAAAASETSCCGFPVETMPHLAWHCLTPYPSHTPHKHALGGRHFSAPQA